MKKLATAIVMIGTLAACGGGGSDGPPASAPVFNADAAFAFALTNGVSFTTLTGTDAGRTFTASLAFAPATDATFAGALRKRSTQTSSLATPGIATQTTTAQLFYATAPAGFVGATQTGSYIEYASQGNLPTAGSVGQSGPFANGTIYASSAKTTQVGTVAITWSIEPDSVTTAFACLTYVSTGSVQTTEKDCFKINAAGTIFGARLTVIAPGINLTLQ